MRVYLPAKKGDDRMIARHTVHVSPGADVPQAETNAEWYGNKGEAKQFAVVFVNGVFDTAQSGIPDSVAKYMLKQGIALKSQPLFRPAYA